MNEHNNEPQEGIYVDYTKWRRTLFGGMTIEELNAAAVAFSEKDPLWPQNKDR